MSLREHGCEMHRGAIPLASIYDVLWSLRRALERASGLTGHLDDLVPRCEALDHRIVYRAGLTVGSSLAATELIARSKVPQIARAAFGCNDVHVMPLHVTVQLPGDPRFDYRWHQEAAFYPWCPDVLNLWLPLGGPAGARHGSMTLIPGSHLGGLRKSTRSGDGAFLQIVPEMAPGEEASAVVIEAEPGDLVAFEANTVHGTIANTSSAPRIYGVLRAINMETQKHPRPLYKALSYEE